MSLRQSITRSSAHHITQSAITIICMIAILKAGCAFTALDASHPTKRLLEVIEDIKAPVLLLSTEQIARFKDIVGLHIVELSNKMLYELDSVDVSDIPSVDVSPSDLMYTIFTSGSTGRPKGVMIEHRAWLTAAFAYGADQELNSGSRVLQFASYAFDMSLMEIFTTLIFGGCVCVPTEDDRFNGIEKFVNEVSVNTLMLTPSYAKLLDPTTMPTVRMLVTGGEAVPSDLIELWNPYVKIYIAYGPTEASIQSSGARLNVESAAVSSGLLGRPTGCNLWIVHEDNHNELVLQGQTGELVVEGHTLARGYLGDDQKTAAAFVNMRTAASVRRVFKTGDLVRQTDNGDMIFIGRKDTQAKMHGQRLELTEIEARLAPALAAGSKCCIEKVESPHFTNGGAIVVFLSETMQISGHAGPEICWNQVETTLEMAVHMQAHLEIVLPKSMMPSLYVPISFIPLTISHKKNRSLLRELIQSLASDKLRKLRKADITISKHRPLCAKELALRELWAIVLNIEMESIGPDDNFIQLGGDSIASIKLIAMARGRGVTLTSVAILSNPVLSVQAQLAVDSTVDGPTQDVKPFELLGSRSKELRETAAALCKLPIDEIEDILPMTTSQMRWYGKTLATPTAWIDQYHFRLPNNVDFERFMFALNSVVQATDLLRARVIATGNKELFQAIIKFNPIGMTHASTTLDAYLNEDLLIPMGLAAVLSRYAIVHLASSDKVFVWTIHHAIYDGFSLPMLLQGIQDLYYGIDPIPFTPFNRYLKGIGEEDLSEGEAFWTTYLLNAAWTNFPALPSREKPSARDRVLASLKIASRQVQPRDSEILRSVTIANVIRVAYGATLSHFSTDRTGSVLFLESLSGRNSSLPGIDRVAGPTLLTIPTKLDLPHKRACGEILLQAQRSLTDRMKFENFPISRLLALVPPLELRSVLLIENEAFLVNGSGRDLFGSGKEEIKLEETEGLPMIFRCTALQDEIHIDIRYDVSVIDGSEVNGFLNTFKGLVESLWHGDENLPLDAILPT
jgi:amino acid adenylation domain-containing protein